VDHHGHIPQCHCHQRDTGQDTWNIDHMKTAILIILFFTVPGIIMGIVSSYRAGQKPLHDLFRKIKNFAQRKNK